MPMFIGGAEGGRIPDRSTVYANGRLNKLKIPKGHETAKSFGKELELRAVVLLECLKINDRRKFITRQTLNARARFIGGGTFGRRGGCFFRNLF